MSRRRLEEALLKSRELESCGESCGESADETSGGDGGEGYSELFVRRRVRLREDPHGIYSLRFSPDGRRIAAGFGNGAVEVLSAGDGSPDGTLFSAQRGRQAVTALRFHPKSPDLLVAAGADGLLSIYDIKSKINVITLTEIQNEINALDFCADGSVFATAGRDRNIRLYDGHTNEIVSVLKAPALLYGDDAALPSGHSRRIFALRFHPSEPHVFVTGGWDNSVKVWDNRVAKEARRDIRGPHICGSGIDIQGNKLLTASWVARDALQLWDLRAAQLVQNVPFPAAALQGQFLYAAAFCSENVVLAGGSGTCAASAIDLRTEQVLGDISLSSRAVQAVDAAPGGREVAAAGVAGNLHIAELC
ncbi:katanin p80 WD40 repeat-containing subunit B1-like [Spea bombifrons]|uniref:katanin p80 WD40 repeat-containing subunit B1-like n=1 Tax=Spea bombifrons TaxID=233779 RepID=UPI00234A856C|nr:katanin p80 WD40 repeat-containing subunit B1-like [Spea bombifrons]